MNDMEEMMQKLDRWMDAHNIEMHIDTTCVTATLMAGELVSHYVTVLICESGSEELAIMKACNKMADDCLIPQPCPENESHKAVQEG